MPSAVLDLARRRQWHRASAACQTITNVLMDGALGGSLYVPSSAYDSEFLLACAKDLDAGMPLYVIERRSAPTFRWHADLDCVSASELGESDFDALVTRALTLLPAKGAPVLVFRAPAKERPDGKVKTGIHLNAPTILVTVGEAIALREAIVRALEASPLSMDNGWEDVVDRAVYEGAGLRLPGMHKIEPCRACPPAGAGRCALCNGTRRVPSDRRYALHSVRTTSGGRLPEWEEKLRRNTCLMLRYASTRHLLQRSGEAPTASKPAAEVARKRKLSSETRGGATVPEMTLDQLAPASALGRHAMLRVVSVHRSETTLTLKVAGPAERWCGNVQREHGSSSVYFVVAHTQLQQRCFCRKYGCSSYAGPGIPLTVHGLRRLGLAQAALPPGFVRRKDS